MSEVISNDAPTSSAPRAPSVVSADRAPVSAPAVAEPESQTSDASTGEEDNAAPKVKTPEQREREALLKARTRLERTNARLWAENQSLRNGQPQQGAQPRQPAAREDAEEVVQINRRDFETAAQTRAREIAAQQVAEEKLAERCNALLDRGVQKDPQFDRALVTVGRELPLFDQKGQPTDALEEILDSKKSVEIILHLRDNPDIAADLAELSPRQLTRRLIALESELTTPTRQVSTAPRPLTPETGAGAASAEPDPEKNPAAWREWRNKTSKVT